MVGVRIAVLILELVLHVRVLRYYFKTRPARVSTLRLDHYRKPSQTEVRTYTWPTLFATLVANSGASYSLVWDSKLYLLKYENTVKYKSVTM